MILTIAVTATLCGDPAGSPGWVEAAKDGPVTVYSRLTEGTSVAEMKAIGLIDATPHEVWAALRDYPAYPKTMPYTEEARVLEREDGDRVTYLYSVVNAPLVDRRDYTIRLLDESEWNEGKGYLKVSWTGSDRGPPPRRNMVRVGLNNGYWKLEPRDGGARTFATYYVHTDPGGSVPKWLVNKANSTAVPAVFAAIRKVVSDGREAKR